MYQKINRNSYLRLEISVNTCIQLNNYLPSNINPIADISIGNDLEGMVEQATVSTDIFTAVESLLKVSNNVMNFNIENFKFVPINISIRNGLKNINSSFENNQIRIFPRTTFQYGYQWALELYRIISEIYVHIHVSLRETPRLRAKKTMPVF